MQSDTDIHAMAAAVAASSQYRVLKRLEARSSFAANDGAETRRGIFLDVETTGLDPSRDEIIELAMVPFTYSLDGRIFDVETPFQGLRQPANPISPQIEALTGLTNEMLSGHSIRSDEVALFASGAALVIAHHASFDRKFVEQLSDVFVTKPWACSMTQVNWRDEGYEGTKLAYLAMSAGFFYERHRAVHDCHAAIALLAENLPKSGSSAFAQLLGTARRPTWRIWAQNSPFDLKDILKARGYRWNADGQPTPRAWYIDIDDDLRESEITFLKTEIYQRDVDLLVRRITAYDRFSSRV
jgi:DNA polymerase-3 subunit epsilon